MQTREARYLFRSHENVHIFARTYYDVWANVKHGRVIEKREAIK